MSDNFSGSLNIEDIVSKLSFEYKIEVSGAEALKMTDEELKVLTKTVATLQARIKELEAELASAGKNSSFPELTKKLEQSEAALAKVTKQFDALKKANLGHFKSFIDANGLSKDQTEVKKLYDEVAAGSKTSVTAMKELQSAFGTLKNTITSGSNDGGVVAMIGGPGGPGDLNEIIRLLRQISEQIVEVRNLMNSGVSTSNFVEAIKNLSNVASDDSKLKGMTESIKAFAESFKSFDSVNATNIASVNNLLTSVNGLGDGFKISKTSLGTLTEFFNAISSMKDVAKITLLSTAEFEKLKTLNDLKISKASATNLNTLFESLNLIKNNQVESLEKLVALPFENLQKININKDAAEQLLNLAAALDTLKAAGYGVGGSNDSKEPLKNLMNENQISTAANKLEAYKNKVIELKKVAINDGGMSSTDPTIMSLSTLIRDITAESTAVKLGKQSNKEFADSFNELTSRVEIFKPRVQEAVKEMEEFSKAVANLEKEEADAAKAASDKKQKESDAAKKKAEAEAQKEKNAALKEYSSIISSIGSKKVWDADSEFTAKLNEYETSLKNLKAEFEKTGDVSTFTSGLNKIKEDLNRAVVDVKKAGNDMTLEKATARLQQDKTKLEKITGDIQKALSDNTAKAGTDAYRNLEEVAKGIDTLKNSFEGMSPEQRSLEIEKLRTAFEKLKSSAGESGKEVKSFGDKLKATFTGYGSELEGMVIRGLGLYRVIGYLKELKSAAVEINSSMTQLQIVTKASSSELSSFGNKASSIANQTAAKIKDVIDATTTYARLGYTLNESADLAKYTTMLQNVGNIDASAAQDAITAIIKAYDKGTGDLEDIMNKFVTVGNNFPISVSQLAEGMNNAGSVLASSGNSFEQSLALLTSANTVIQNISKSSTGLRTITARLRKMDTELNELGETVTEADYDEIVKALTKQNVSLTAPNGELRSTYDIIKDIAAAWKDMNNNERAALAEKLAGTRQQSIFYGLVENFQEASGAMDAMASSSGALNEANEIYLSSTEAHMQKLNNSIQKLGVDLFDSSLMNFFIDLGNVVVTTVDFILQPLKLLKNQINILFEDSDQKIARLSNAVSDASKEAKNIATSYKEVEAAFDGSIDEFVNLAKGVDEYGKNISLTSDEYIRFLELRDQFAAMFPEIDMGLDSSGHHMLALSYSSDTLTESLTKLLAVQEKVAQKEIASYVDSIISSTIALDDHYKSEVSSAESAIKVTKELVELYKNVEDYKTFEGSTDLEEINKLTDATNALNNSLFRNRNSELTLKKLTGFTFEDIENDVANGTSFVMNSLLVMLDYYKGEIADSFKSLTPELISAWLSTNDNFSALGSSLQEYISEISLGINLSELGFNSKEEVKKYLVDNYVEPIFQAGEDIQKEIVNAFDIKKAVRNGQRDIKDYQAAFRSLYKALTSSNLGSDVIDSIVHALHEMTVESANVDVSNISNASTIFTDLRKDIDEASASLAGFKDEMSKPDQDEGLNTIIEAFEKLKSEAELGRYNSNDFISAANILGLDTDQSLEDIDAWIKSMDTLYGKHDDLRENIFDGFFKQLSAGVSSGDLAGLAEFNSESGTWWVDPFKLEETAKAMNMSETALLSFLQAIEIYDRQYRIFNGKDMLPFMQDNGILKESKSEMLLFSDDLQKQLIDGWGFTEKEASKYVDEIYKDIQGMDGFEDVRLISFAEDQDIDSLIFSYRSYAELIDSTFESASEKASTIVNQMQGLTSEQKLEIIPMLGLDQSVVDEIAKLLPDLFPEGTSIEAPLEVTVDASGVTTPDEKDIDAAIEENIGDYHYEYNVSPNEDGTSDITYTILYDNSQFIDVKKSVESLNNAIKKISDTEVSITVNGDNIDGTIDKLTGRDGLGEAMSKISSTKVFVDIEYHDPGKPGTDKVTIEAPEEGVTASRSEGDMFFNVTVTGQEEASEEIQTVEDDFDNLVDSSENAADAIEEFNESGVDGDAISGDLDGISESADGAASSVNNAQRATNNFNNTSVNASNKVSGINDTSDSYRLAQAEAYLANNQLNIWNGTTVKPKELRITTIYETKGTPPAQNAKGTKHADPGLSLLGDEFSPDGSPRPELVVSDGTAYLAGVNGPVIGNLKAGDIVYPYKDTKKILASNKFSGSLKGIPAFYNGNVSEAYDKWQKDKNGGNYYDNSTNNYYYDGGSGGGGGGGGDDEENWFEKQYRLHNHYVNLDQEVDADYFSWLEKAWKQAYKEGLLTEAEAFKYEEEVHQGKKKMFQDEVSRQKQQLDLGFITTEEYYKWLEKRVDEAYLNNEITIDEFFDYQIDLYDHAKQVVEDYKDAVDDYFNDIDSKISMLENAGKSDVDIIKYDEKGMKFIEKRIAELVKEGKDNNDEEVQALQRQWWDYYNDRADREKKATDDAKKSTDDLVDFRIKMLKKDLDKEKENISKKKSYLKEFYDTQKKMLRDANDEDKYLDEQAEKRKAVSDIEMQLTQLELDNSAWAQKRKLELEQQLSEAKKDLSDFEKDHALKQAEDLLDGVQEAQQKELETQEKNIEDLANNPAELYKQALEDIRKGGEDLYKDMLEYNRMFGTGNDNDVKNMWDEGYTALKRYKELFGETYDGYNMTFGEDTKEPEVDTSKIDAGGGPISPGAKTPKVPTPPSEPPKPKKSSTNKDSTKDGSTTTGTLTAGKQVTIKSSYAAYAGGSYVSNPYYGKGSKLYAVDVPGLSFPYKLNGTDWVFLSKTGTYSTANGVGWIKLSDLEGYAKGTSNATAGLHAINEAGSEYLFQSKNGNSYRMFNNGDKVLNAKATDFLYRFANRPSEILASLLESAAVSAAGSVNTVVSPVINMGDIIINGNADTKTVSQIRREQRDAMDFVLKGINRLAGK